jgi:hypothetical protein
MANSARGLKRITITKETKARWFTRGAERLGADFPQYAGLGYACPVCLRPADINALTAEDVPPRRVGGRPLVLTCADCNSHGGYALDVHWGHLVDVVAFARGELDEPLAAELVIGGSRTQIDLTRIGGQVEMSIVKDACNPEAIQAQQALLQTKKASPKPFTLWLKRSRFDEWKAIVSILRAAYLVGFAVGGTAGLAHGSRSGNKS